MEKVETKISRDLMEAVEARASKEGRGSDEVVEDALRSYLIRHGDGSVRNLRKIFDSIDKYQRERGVEPLSEEEAMKLAVEEQRAWRRERRENQARESEAR